MPIPTNSTPDFPICEVANPGGSPCTKPKGHDGGHDLAAYGSLTNIPILDDDAVGEIEARAAKASSGPWIVTDGQHIDQYGHHPDGNRLLSEGSYDANYHMFGADDIEFIAHARADIPALCQTVRALRAENERLKRQLGQGEKSDVFSGEYAALGHDEKDTQ